MATTTHVDPKREIAPVSDEFEDAYEIIDGLPIGRPINDPLADAYEEAYEVVDGRILEWPEMGAYPEELASILHLYLGAFVRQQELGRAIVETRFQIRPKQQRRPDLAFISFDRWPKGRRAPRGAWKLIPDLVVEVVSENDKAWKVLAKVREYCDAGVPAVWVIYPNVETVHVYSSYTRIEVVTRDQTLDGGTVIPGFRLALADLFEGEAEPEAEPTGPTEPTSAS